jgi:N-acetylmuramoyl-L-alanine amidase
LNHSCFTDRLANDPIRFTRPQAKSEKECDVFVMKREARTRFFFFSGSILLLLVCLLVTPTSATAPQAKKTAPAQNEPRPHGPMALATDVPKTLEPRQQERRPAIRASRDERRTATRARVRLTEREMELLARLVYAEGRGEPYEGQVAIAAVVLNRVKSPQFPNTVREVIYQPNAFSPVNDGHLTYKTNDTARKAVRDAVNGKDPSRGSLYFYNPKTATSDWIRTRPLTVRIANHVFAR